jgi:AraC family transcriptional regulator
MNTRRADQNYRERVARVVAAIVADPMAAHRLEDLARLAHFSPFHFHRVYSSIAGETVAATVRRVRLALATRLLEHGRQSITQVALAVGYDSPQAFTRAFGQFTGQSPRAFQQQMQALVFDAEGAAIGNLGSVGDTDSAGNGDTAPLVRIVERPARRAYAIRHCGPLSTIPHTQRRLRRHPGAGTASEWLGASFGDPEDATGYSYYAAAVSPEPWSSVDVKVEVLDIPGGRYALHRLAGPYSRIDAAVSALYSRWLPASGYDPDDRPTLEHYLNSPRHVAQADLRTDLLIPIRSTKTP